MPRQLGISEPDGYSVTQRSKTSLPPSVIAILPGIYPLFWLFTRFVPLTIHMLRTPTRSRRPLPSPTPRPVPISPYPAIRVLCFARRLAKIFLPSLVFSRFKKP